MLDNKRSDHSLLFDVLKLLSTLAIYVILLGSLQLLALYLLGKQFSIRFYEEMSLTERLYFAGLNTMVILVIYLYKRKSFGLKPLVLNFKKQLLLRYTLFGIMWSLLLIGLTAVITSYFLPYKISLNTDFDVVTLLTYLVFFLIAAYNEELLCRGIFLGYLLKENAVWIALVFSSLLFTGLHMGNPDFSLLAFTNIFCAGIIFGLLYIYGGKNLYLPTIFHAGWNFFQGPVLGFAVSGFKLPNTLFLVESNSSTSAINFGLEGTAACAYINVAFILILSANLYYTQKQSQKIPAPY